MSFNTNSSVLDLQNDEPMVCPGAPRIPFESFNWGDLTPLSSPDHKADHHIEGATQDRLGLGISGVSFPLYTNFSHNRSSNLSSTNPGTAHSGAGSSNRVVVPVDAEMKENRSGSKKTRLVQIGNGKGGGNAV